MRFRRDIIGLIWLSTGIFLGLALYSYTPQDPSFSSSGANVVVANYCGYFGSFLADGLFLILGLSAWVLVVGAIRLALKSFLGENLSLNWWRLLWAGLLFVTLSSLGALYFPEEKFFENHVYVGGMLGSLTARGLTTLFNFAGVAVILWTSMLVLIIFYTEMTLKDLLKWPGQRLSFFAKKEALSTLYENLKSSLFFFVEKLKWLLFPFQQLALATGSLTSRKAKEEKGPIIENKSFFKIAQENQEEDLEEEDDDSESEEIEVLDSLEEDVEKPQLSLFRKKKDKKRKVSLSKKVQRRINNWELPNIELMEDPPYGVARVDDAEIRKKSGLLTNKLEQFSVRGNVVGAKPGPAITLFEFKPDIDIKISKITDLADDLSLALSSESVRIIAPIPGRDVVGIETSNRERETVYLKDIVASDDFWDNKVKLPIAVGTKADGSKCVVDLRKMPHLMVAGSTGSGKSVFVVSILTGLLLRHSPETLKLILIDPKQVDLAVFNDLPHLVMPPIRETKKAVTALKWAIKEMDKRYRSMAKFKARDIETYNKTVGDLPVAEAQKHEEWNESLEGAQRLEDYYYSPQPYITIVVEEFGDLMAVDKNNVESSIVRLAQMARACGIHLILAMQSPRKDVVTGLIKTNIPGRISFKVASKMDSRIILDESGAERLLTRGDMLFLAPGVSKPERHHGPWLSDQEISEITKFWKDQGEPEYDLLAMRALEGSGGGYDVGGEGVAFDSEETDEFDEKYDEVLAFVSTQKTVSASMLQRRFRLGYPRAARMIEMFEAEGVVGPANGSKPRQVLVSELK